VSEQAAAQQVRQPATAAAPSRTRGVLQRACACGKHTTDQNGECTECRKKRLGLQRRAVGSGPDVAPPIVHEVLRSPGRPLDDATRGFMESRFNHDFSRVPATPTNLATAGLPIGPANDSFEREAERQSQRAMRSPATSNASLVGPDFSRVRVHTDSRAAESAHAVNALAYTVGEHVVFDVGQYAPGTSAGRGLLAHELTHVMHQGGATTQPSPLIIQRQPSPLTSSADPGSRIAAQDYAEVSDRPSYRIRIIAHASPRWRSASSHPTADLQNLKLSEQRSNAVHKVVDEVLQQLPGMWTTVTVDDADDNIAGTVGTKSEFRGSRDTLKEAKGNRSDDALLRRRVDVAVKSNRRVSGHAAATGPILTKPTASKFWRVSVDLSAGATALYSGELLVLQLTNDLTGQSMEGRVWATGIGIKAPLGVSVSPWSDPVWFDTHVPMNFRDFDGIEVIYANFGISFFIGYEWASISFTGLGRGADDINVSGGSVGTPGLGGDVVGGTLSMVGPYPPTEIPIKDSDKLAVPYERTETGEYVHTVTFPTESATLSELELEMLQVFLKNVITD
jgi:hypothetical protein